MSRRQCIVSVPLRCTAQGRDEGPLSRSCTSPTPVYTSPRRGSHGAFSSSSGTTVCVQRYLQALCCVASGRAQDLPRRHEADTAQRVRVQGGAAKAACGGRGGAGAQQHKRVYGALALHSGVAFSSCGNVAALTGREAASRVCRGRGGGTFERAGRPHLACVA